jgi:hypothetical protein
LRLPQSGSRGDRLRGNSRRTPFVFVGQVKQEGDAA